MSDSTPRQALGVLADGQELDPMQINDALVQFDAMTDIYLLGQFVNTPPASPADGDMYLLGAAPTGAWMGRAYKIAYCIDGGWRFYAPFNGLRAYVAATHGFLVYVNGSWIDANALISATEVSIASAATCDLGAAGSLFVAITGTTAITGFGTGANLVRFVRFAGALTLTHNAASLILPGAANIVTAAGDSAIFASDASGNWRCRNYARADGMPICFTGVTGSGKAVGDTAPSFAGPVGIGMTPVNVLDITRTQNAGSVASLLNASTGTAAYSELHARNSASAVAVGIFGTGYASSGIFRADAAYVYASGAGGLMLATGAAQPICFAVNNTEKARFSTSGALMIGGTSLMDSSNTAAGVNLAASYSWFASDDAMYLQRPGGADGGFLRCYKGSALVGSISVTGSTTAYNTTSDARLKRVSQEQRDYRGAIRDLWIGDFCWKDSGAPGFGVLAQQAYAVMPNHAGVTRPAADDEPWHASAEPFAFLALWGVKDIYAQVAALSARIAALEAAHEAG
jgi:hypothetical protein